ncbi:phosphomannomutase [Candidatus Falkowbacteria bacterium RBG_13_39_14]|uniref:Phosphomannomutase n=1 Tax=Candidatus Falkowbacteria bacterium RBG_13_39_14 TaxID=1797985 RepID=A0A1F5S7Z4_9BACT|nr:MAG: phosphomannomutase [Candidatus Falkowbacteria bacterium RBG_13_39_14]
MYINPHIFREYDIRGIADTDLTEEVAEQIGKAYGSYIKSKEIIVGMDNRLSSERIKRALIKGILLIGKNVIDIGITINPIFYYSRVLYGIEGGAMVTGSHNPKEYNGFKLCKGDHTMVGRQIRELKDLIQNNKFISSDTGKVILKNPLKEFQKMVKEKIILNKKFKVVVDCGNGTAGIFAPAVFRNWGCEVVPLYCESDGNFPNHIPDPTKTEAMRELIAAVLRGKADIGFGFDGDGDRIGVVDNKGNIIWGDMLQILFQRELLKKNPGEKVIIEVKCSQSLYDDVLKHGGKPIFWKTGHSLIKEKMLEEDALIAGEMSGHTFFRDEYFGYDDALYAAGRVLRILDKTGKSLYELLADAPKYFSTPEIRALCPDEVKFEIVKRIVEDFKKMSNLEESGIKKVIDIDGARVVFENGWGLVRASNTQPALIIRAEGKTEEDLEKIKGVLENKMGEFPEVEFEWE